MTTGSRCGCELIMKLRLYTILRLWLR